MRTLSTVLIKSGSFTGSFSGSSVNVTEVSASYGYFGLNAVVNGILKVFDVIYAYSGVVGSITGSLSGTASFATSAYITVGFARLMSK